MTAPSRFCAAYLDAARAALGLVEEGAVDERWALPSALPEMSVGALACHLAGQTSSTEAALDNPVTSDEVVPVLVHYSNVAWRGAPLEQETNRAIRASAQRNADLGPPELRRSTTLVLARLAQRLPALDGGMVVQPPWITWALRLDDFLLTRLVELTVHLDDLAVSLDVTPAPLPESVQVPVRHLLVDLAAQRHGDRTVLRALSRHERAEGPIHAF